MLDVLVRLKDLSASMSIEIFRNFFKCNLVIVLLQHLLYLTFSLTYENLLLVQFCVQKFDFQIWVLGSGFWILNSEFSDL